MHDKDKFTNGSSLTTTSQAHIKLLTTTFSALSGNNAMSSSFIDYFPHNFSKSRRSSKDLSQSHKQCTHAMSFPQENIAYVFPSISLNYAGDASMNLTPTNYLEDMGFVDGAAKW
uniref:Uncharacterized protein n=1 Tax=Solanum lycopersicum TaxID=4081 RepID=A0A3Q7EBA3_SOLLC